MRVAAIPYIRNQTALVVTTPESIEQIITSAVRKGIADFFASNQFQSTEPTDELGGVDLTHRVTGLAIPTIRTKCHLRQMPFSKPIGSKRLIFSRCELEAWMRTGKRQTRVEITDQIN